MTENPTKEFVRQRIMEIQDRNPPGMHLIHDNVPQFTAIDYPSYGIVGTDTSVAAPNMKTEESEGSGQVYLGIAELTMVAA